MKEISLSGKYKHFNCILDDGWAEMFKDGGIKIMFGSGGMGGYAFIRCDEINGRQRADRVHSLVMDFIGSSRKLVVDHINGNKLDNRRCNLRIITQIENCSNKNNKMNISNKTGVRGLCYCKKLKSFIVYMRASGKKLYRKSFKNIKEATLVAEFNNEIRQL